MKHKLRIRWLTACMLVLSAVMLLWIGSVSAASDFSPRWPLGSAFHSNALDHYSGGGQHNGIDIAAGRGSAVYGYGRMFYISEKDT